MLGLGTEADLQYELAVMDGVVQGNIKAYDIYDAQNDTYINTICEDADSNGDGRSAQLQILSELIGHEVAWVSVDHESAFYRKQRAISGLAKISSQQLSVINVEEI